MHRVRATVDIAATSHTIAIVGCEADCIVVPCAQCGKLVTGAWRGEAARAHRERAVHVFGLSGVVGDLANVHSTQGMTGAAEINLSSLTSYAAGSKAATSGEDNA